MGCIKAIPGSHKDGIRTHDDTFGEDNILTRGQTVADVNEAEAVDLILRPGQMSIHHARTVHGSMPNQGDERRMGIALQAYMGPDSRQTIGEHLVQVVQGCEDGGDFSVLPRPDADRDESGAGCPCTSQRQLGGDSLRGRVESESLLSRLGGCVPRSAALDFRCARLLR